MEAINEEKIDHRSYVRQGKEQEPTRHEGYTAREMEKRGEVSERCQENREIKKRNNLIQTIAERLATIGTMLRQLEANRDEEKRRAAEQKKINDSADERPSVLAQIKTRTLAEIKRDAVQKAKEYKNRETLKKDKNRGI